MTIKIKRVGEITVVMKSKNDISIFDKDVKVTTRKHLNEVIMRLDIPVLNNILEIDESQKIDFGTAVWSDIENEKSIVKQTLEDNFFSSNVLLCGDKASGKTYEATKYANEKCENVILISGHPDIESYELLGSYIPTEKDMVFVRGPLSEAFVKAENEKVILVIDEMLRIKSENLAPLISALTPHSDGMLHLKTNRVVSIENSVGVTEELVCDPKNLWVVGTTNIGAKYDVNDIELAMKDRFKISLVEKTYSEIKDILLNMFDSKEKVNTLMKIYRNVKNAEYEGKLTDSFNLRHLKKALEKEDPIKELESFKANICGLSIDGKLIESEEILFEEILFNN